MAKIDDLLEKHVLLALESSEYSKLLPNNWEVHKNAYALRVVYRGRTVVAFIRDNATFYEKLCVHLHGFYEDIVTRRINTVCRTLLFPLSFKYKKGGLHCEYFSSSFNEFVSRRVFSDAYVVMESTLNKDCTRSFHVTEID